MSFLSFDAECMFSPVIIILFNKKVTKQVHKKIGISNYTRDHSTSIKSAKKGWSSADIKSQ